MFFRGGLMINNIKIEMNANKNNITFARGAIASFLMNCDLTINLLNEIKTIISEAVTNSIVHGYKNDENKKVYLEFILNNDELTMVIEDFGVGIEDIEKAKEPLFTTKLKEERAGLGFTIMEVFSDKMEIYSAPNKGTKIVCYKHLICNECND